MALAGKCAARTRTRAQRDSAERALSPAASPLHGRDHLLCVRARGGHGGSFRGPLPTSALSQIGNNFLANRENRR